jgi:hypothetical protein
VIRKLDLFVSPATASDPALVRRAAAKAAGWKVSDLIGLRIEN